MTNEIEKRFKEQVLHILYGIISNPNVFDEKLAKGIAQLKKIVEEQTNDGKTDNNRLQKPL